MVFLFMGINPRVDSWPLVSVAPHAGQTIVHNRAKKKSLDRAMANISVATLETKLGAIKKDIPAKL